MRVRLLCNPSRDRSCRSVGFRPRQVMPARRSTHESTILALARMCGVCSQPARAAGRGGDDFRANWGLAGRLFWGTHLAWHLAASADGFGKIPRGSMWGSLSKQSRRCFGSVLRGEVGVFMRVGCSPSNGRIEASTPCPASMSAGEPRGTGSWRGSSESRPRMSSPCLGICQQAGTVAPSMLLTTSTKLLIHLDVSLADSASSPRHCSQRIGCVALLLSLGRQGLIMDVGPHWLLYDARLVHWPIFTPATLFSGLSRGARRDGGVVPCIPPTQVGNADWAG